MLKSLDSAPSSLPSYSKLKSVERNRYNSKLYMRFRKAPWYIAEDFKKKVRHELVEAHMRVFDMENDA